MDDPTTIQVDKTTREKLKKIGAKGETYDAIILRLIAGHGAGQDHGAGEDKIW